MNLSKLWKKMSCSIVGISNAFFKSKSTSIPLLLSSPSVYQEIFAIFNFVNNKIDHLYFFMEVVDTDLIEYILYQDFTG